MPADDGSRDSGSGRGSLAGGVGTERALEIEIPRGGAALLDFDGTLSDTFPIHLRAYNEVLAEAGHDGFPWPIYRERVVRDGARPLDVLREIGFDVGEEIYRRKARRFASLARETLRPREGMQEFVSDLQAAGLRLAVVTSAGRPSVIPSLEAVWPGPPPDLVVTREDVARPKPDPEGFLLAMDLLRVRRSETIVFEDAPPGIRAASGAGSRCIAVHGHVFGPGDLGEASLVVDSWTRLVVEPRGRGGVRIRLREGGR